MRLPLRASGTLLQCDVFNATASSPGIQPSESAPKSSAGCGVRSLDEQGKAIIEGHPRIPVRLLVGQALTNGWSPHELKWQFPQLTMSEIYAALAYYHDHEAEMDVENEADWGEIPVARTLPSRSELEKRRPPASA